MSGVYFMDYTQYPYYDDRETQEENGDPIFDFFNPPEPQPKLGCRSDWRGYAVGNLVNAGKGLPGNTYAKSMYYLNPSLVKETSYTLIETNQEFKKGTVQKSAAAPENPQAKSVVLIKTPVVKKEEKSTPGFFNRLFSIFFSCFFKS